MKLWRLVAAGITLVGAAGTSIVFWFVAGVIASSNCEDGCGPGSRWAPGAWGSTVQLWGLAFPAVICAIVLVWAVGSARRLVATLAWTAMTGLLVGWCVFVGAVDVSIDFSASNSHWMWLTGLLVCSGSGLVGVLTTRPS